MCMHHAYYTDACMQWILLLDQISFPIENDTPQDACEFRISQNAYYADACIWVLCMHLSVVNNAIFELMYETIAQDIFSQ